VDEAVDPVAVVPAVEPAVDPVAVEPPAVEVDPADALALAALPVTWILWPTCLSRSVPPVNHHVEFIADAADPLPDGVVLPAVAAPVVPVAVEPAVPVAPAVVVALGSVVVAADALPAGSMRAFVSMNPPSLPLARHPVTLTSLARSLDIGRGV